MDERRMNGAIFLDRDGTIIEDNGHLSNIDDVEVFPFAIDALKMLQKEYPLFIVTNQSGVGLGRIKMEDVEKINNRLLVLLREQGIEIKKLYCCSHKRDDNCNCIKPKPFFIQEAAREFNIDISKSYTIGDHPHDVTFGKAAGGEGLYVLTGHGKKHLEDISQGTKCFENLFEAAQWIINNKMTISQA